MNAIIYSAGILLQLVASVIALLQVRYAPRKLPWLFIAVSSLIIVFRRAATLDVYIDAGKPLALPEILTLFVSLLFFLGVLSMSEMFRGIRRTIEALRQSEEAVRKSEAKYHALFDVLPTGITLSDEHGLVIESNQSANRMLWPSRGSDPTRHVDGSDWSIVGPDGAPMPPEELATNRALKEHAPVLGVEMGIVAEGTIRWSLVNATRAESNRVVATYEDITERNQMEEEIIRSQLKYSIIANNTYDWEFWLDPQGDPVYHSPSCKRITGYDAKDFSSNPGLLLGIIHPDDLQAYTEHRSLAQTSREPGSVEFRIIARDGRVRSIGHVCQPVVDASGKFLGTRGSNRDVTEQKLMEKEVEELSLFPIQNPSPTLRVNKSGIVVKCNPAADLLGVRPGNLISSFFPELAHLDFGNCISSDGLLTQEVNVNNTVIQFTICGNSSLGTASLFGADVSELKRAEGEVRDLLKEKELILREVHHRIKNNMNTVRSLLSLQARMLNDPGAVAALKDSEQRVYSMMSLYDKLYRSEHINELPADIYLSKLIDDIVGTFPNKNIVHVVKDLAPIVLGPKVLSAFGLILNETITNAMKYAFIDRSNGILSVSLKALDRRLKLEVADDGVGLPNAVDIGSSQNFGLYLVQILAMQLDGEIRLTRAGGTAWTLDCPLP
jgi:PAS domain S-box-containing protein